MMATVLSGGRAAASDAVAPTVVITSVASSITTAAFTCTFTFSEDVTGFALGDITVGNGTAGTFNTVSPSVYTVVITPTALGTVTVDVGAGVCVDEAGNANEASNTFSILYMVAALWSDKSDITTLYQTNNTTTPVTADGQTIGYAADKSGTGNHLLQSAAGNRPLYKANIQNGKSVARADADDLLIDVIAISQPFTIISVFKPASITGVRQYVLCQDNFNVQMSVEAAGTIAISAGTRIASVATIGAAFQIVTGVYNGASSEIFLNGTSIKTGDAGANALTNVQIPFSMASDNAEHFIFSGALTEPQRQAVEAYLNAKWSVF